MGTCYSLSPQSITPVHLGNIIIHQQQEQLQDQPHRNDRQPQLEEACGRQSSTKCSGDSGFKSSGSPTEPPQSVHGFLEDIFLDDRTVCTEHDNQRADNYLPSRMDLHPTSLREEVSRFDEAPGEEAEPLRERSCYSEFPSLSNSTVAVYAKRRVSTKGLPRPGSTDSTFACVLRLRKILQLTEENRITKRVLLENLNYALDVVTKTYIEETKRLRDEDDELSETACSEVPDEVRDWLATTFTRHQSNGGRPITKPRFRSVVNAIRAGIVVERWEFLALL
ncbi:unnamed protein product [Mesocestoides corti]|uniref:PDEase_I_N domain-containing protein n=1 Tax=Mesocestoides corti TaxID=53468 RepID=A0A0R3UHW8_MESCO|nr:unnamed protein product [Mesocestoides corti]